MTEFASEGNGQEIFARGVKNRWEIKVYCNTTNNNNNNNDNSKEGKKERKKWKKKEKKRKEMKRKIETRDKSWKSGRIF